MSVIDYIIDQPEPNGSIMGFLHDYLMSNYPHLQAKIRYKIPFYDGIHWICYLNPLKTGGVELAFIRGIELSNELGILKSKGRKQIYGLDILNMDNIPLDAIYTTIEEAIILDSNVPYKHLKTRNR